MFSQQDNVLLLYKYKSQTRMNGATGATSFSHSADGVLFALFC